MSSKPNSWNSELYQSSHSFVWQYGRDLLVLLNAKPGERILDVGCGTGQLTAEITQFGAEVVGIDSSAEMIASARKNFPQVTFEVADVTALTYADEFDVVISNAALHWVRDQPAAIASIARALKRGGRLIFEMGGRGNLRHLLDAVYQALRALGVGNPEQLSPWSFPSIGEYAPLLEAHGLEVDFAVLFDRATILEGGDRGLKMWLEMFGRFAVEAVAPEQRKEFLRLSEQFASPALFHNGVWTIDYKRLRLVAVKL
ncbi:MAG: methyltransferase domain-containing protein [Candidatus Korobacteraceae bacterium]|jgi:trans-aconitate methyltransferase